MSRIPFSVRFPAELGAALDRIAEHCGQSRSDLVETVIKGLETEDLEMVRKTAVAGAPTEKRNLRLSPDALTRLTQLAGELEPAEFLRRMIGYVVANVPPGLYQNAAPRGNGHGPASTQPYRGPHRHPDAEDYVETPDVRAGAGGPVALAVLLFGFLVTLIVWLLCWRREPPSPGSDNNR